MEIGVEIPRLRVVIKWIMRAFSGHLPPEQLLTLWDIILAYDSLEIIPLLAVVIISFQKGQLTKSHDASEYRSSACGSVIDCCHTIVANGSNEGIVMFYQVTTSRKSAVPLFFIQSVYYIVVIRRASCFYTAAKSNLVCMLYSEFETKCYFKLLKMSYLTESLKIEILMMIGYGDRARTQCEVVRLFRETHPDLPPLNQGTISKIEAKYREMGHVRKVPSKRQAVVDDDTKLNLLLALEENPITPARQLARDSLKSHV
ncbi:hypothetical protein NQ318_013012 [Aromia moschata]|uniref:Rab-GAP TBC domain-containing protein n=1 Tax=Aromia moschata TaxID=1265417 RepID=A0AAV8XUJ9_9CUCU|nr:hypothetical protein NQ318_013012 [Aromia moschata]